MEVVVFGQCEVEPALGLHDFTLANLPGGGADFAADVDAAEVCGEEE